MDKFKTPLLLEINTSYLLPLLSHFKNTWTNDITEVSHTQIVS